MLLTSAGIKNPSIHRALLDLLGKPIAEANALCIPTAAYANHGGLTRAWAFVAGRETQCPMTELGWKSVGVLELSVLLSIDRDAWVRAVRDADVLLVNGGDPIFLAHWLVESGLADLLPTLDDTLWVGFSAGSMIMAPHIGADFVGWQRPGGGDHALGLIDFSIFPHLDHPDLPENTMADAERWAAGLSHPAYAIDDATALTVVDDAVEVVSEGHWRHFTA